MVHVVTVVVVVAVCAVVVGVVFVGGAAVSPRVKAPILNIVLLRRRHRPGYRPGYRRCCHVHQLSAPVTSGEEQSALLGG